MNSLKRKIALLLSIFMFFQIIVLDKNIQSVDAASYNVPGRIESENYTSMQGVETGTCSEGGSFVGWIDAGDTIDYSINVKKAGQYNLVLRIAAPSAGKKLELIKVGGGKLSILQLPKSGDYQKWVNAKLSISLTVGIQTLRINALTGGFNLNWIEFTYASISKPTVVPTIKPTNEKVNATPMPAVVVNESIISTNSDKPEEKTPSPTQIPSTNSIVSSTPNLSITPTPRITPLPKDLIMTATTQSSLKVMDLNKIELMSKDATYNSVNLQWNVISETNISEYVILRNSAKIATVKDKIFNDTKLAPGQKYTYIVEGIDPTGKNVVGSKLMEVTTKKDTMAPTQPTNLKVVSKSSSTVILSWDKSIDETNVNYQIYRDGIIVGGTNETSYEIKGMKSESSHKVKLVAIDEGMNKSNEVSIDIKTDAVVMAKMAVALTLNNIIDTDLILTSNVTYTGDVELNNGILDLNGKTLIIQGNLNHSNGTIDINGGKLLIGGNYNINSEYISPAPILQMTNTLDYVSVAGNFYSNSAWDSRDTLTAGTLEVKGNFTQDLIDWSTYSMYVYSPTGTHKTILSGTLAQSISFASPGYSWFNILEIKNTSSSGISFNNKAYVTNQLYSTSSKVLNSENLVLNNQCQIINGIWNWNISEDSWIAQKNEVIQGNFIVDDWTGFDLNGKTVEIRGNLTQLVGTIDINGGKLLIGGNYNINSEYISPAPILQMTNTLDYVSVAGNFYSNSAWDSRDTLTAGTLEVKGNFTQDLIDWSSMYVYSPTGTHKTILSGNGVQNITFASPNYSIFNILMITKPLKKGYTFNYVPCWKTLISYDGEVFHEGKGVYSPTGNYSKTYTDMALQAPGTDLAITREYNSDEGTENTFLDVDGYLDIVERYLMKL